MTTPPRWPFTDPTDALDAILAGTFWPRVRRYHDQMELWLEDTRPPLGVRHGVKDEAA